MFRFFICVLSLAFICGLPARAQLSSVDTAGLAHKNLLDQSNPGFENAKNKWTASSAATFTLETAAPLIGAGSASFDATATSQTVESASVTIPAGLQGRQCLVKLTYQYNGTTGDYTLAVHDGSDNDLVADSDSSSGLLEFADTDSATRSIEAGFVCPTSGTLNIQIASTADGGDLLFDEVWLGSDYRIGKQDGAELVANAYYPNTTNCAWATTTTGAVAAFPTDTDCPSITVAYSNYAVDTTDNNLPDIDFDNLPPGIYVVTAEFMISGSTTNMSWSTAISDGSTTSGTGQGGGGSTNDNHKTTVTGVFKYETAGARNFAVHASTSTGTSTISVNAANRALNFTVVRYPLTPTDSVTLETQGAYLSVYHSGTDCAWANTTSASYASPTGDSTCTLETVYNRGYTVVSDEDGTGKIPGLTLTPPFAGGHEVCATFTLLGGTVSAYCAAQIYDGTNSLVETERRNDDASGADPFYLCARVDYDSVAAKDINLRAKCSSGLFDFDRSQTRGVVEWTVKPLTQNFPQAVALTGYKWQRKILSANVTSASAEMTDLTFALEPGKTYRITIKAEVEITGASGNGTSVLVKDGSTTINQVYERLEIGTANATAYASMIYTVTDGDLTFVTGPSTNATRYIAGNGTLAETWAEVELLPGHAQYSGW